MPEISLNDSQRDSPDCGHTDQARSVSYDERVCPECVARGDEWVHLRICMSCGQVGCCDSSPNRHARSHSQTSGHPIIKSIEPGEDWAWCYPDDAYLG